MTTITYTYDETKATNKDYLIAVLTDSIDDCGASYEAVARYNIACPYSHNSDCLNNHESNKYDSKEYREGCVRCKMAWLERVYDTYPSEDGVWEPQESEE